MIFVTIGTQEPFNRLIKAVDAIGDKLNDKEITAQAFGVDFAPKNIKLVELLPPDEFNRLFTNASLIISHAGMGNIISALQFSKPIIILPRLVEFGEHRNEHQLHTAKKFESLGYVNVAYSAEELEKMVFEHFDGTLSSKSKTLSNSASDTLISSISQFVNSYKANGL
jgi:UDP-N-acetylglucosamine transferase subunit ALG13